MSELIPLIDLYCDEQLLPHLQQLLDAFLNRNGKLATMAQIQGLFRRAQAVRQAGDVFISHAGQTNDASFEAWLQYRIKLEVRRGNSVEQAFFEMIHNQLFGEGNQCLRRAANANLVEWGSGKPSPSERAQVQTLLFHRWIHCFCSRARYLINQEQRTSHGSGSGRPQHSGQPARPNQPQHTSQPPRPSGRS